MKMRAWYFLCILFFFYSINTLIEESYDVAYRFENKTEEIMTEKYEHLACFNFKNIIYPSINITEINLNQLKWDVYSYLNKQEGQIQKKYLQRFNEIVLVPIRERESLIFRDMFCFQVESKAKLIRIHLFQSLFRRSLLLFAYKNNTFDLFNIYILNKFEQLIVLNKGYPYSTCIEGYSRFYCLNKCFKEKNRISKYLYRLNETNDIIQLNYDNNNTTLKDNEDECFKKCKNNECKFIYFTKKKDTKFWENPKIIFFKAYPTMSLLDYWIQLAGLGFFFTGLSSYQILSKFIKILNSSSFFNQILTKFIKLIRSKIQKDEFKRRLLNTTKAIIVFIMISCLVYFYFNLIMTYKWNLNYPIKKDISLNLIESEPISLVICVTLFSIFFRDYDNIKTGTYPDKNLLNLEKDSDIGFKNTLKEIYIVLQNEKIEVKWILRRKVLFYDFSRCFLVDVFPSEPKYQSVLSITKLVIKFHHNDYDFFLLPYDKSFHSNRYPIEENQNYDFIKKIRKSTKECENYNQLNSKLPCTSKVECINRCYNQEFIKNYGNISGHSVIVIDKDHFTKEQWEKSFVYDKFDEQIRKKCEKQITKKECHEVKFERNIKIKAIRGHKIVIFDFYYGILKEVEIEPIFYDLLLDMVNIQSYFFGLNTFKLFFMIYLLIKSKFKFHLLITIYIICMLGSIYQSYYISNKIINEELDQSQHYKLLEKLRMPEIIFCIDFDESLIDMNHKLTGNYLDEITKDVRIETVFDRVFYLDNRTNGWIMLESNFTGKKFRIENFFFLNEKCFNIILDMEYHRDQFYFSLDSNFGSNVLKIFFNQRFIDRMFYFMTKPKAKIEFSKLLKLNFKTPNGCKAVLVSQELFEFIYNDKFSFIKNPISVFYGENKLNDASHYLSNLLNNFKRSFNRLRTLKLPLKENYFNDEIDDDLFEQYYLQVQNVTDNYLSTDSNYQRSLATNYYSEKEISFKQTPDFIFNLIFYKKVITTTNIDNHIKLIINLLNILSIWFDLGVLDLHAYAHKIKFIFTFIFRLFLEIERLIKKVLVMTHCS